MIFIQYCVKVIVDIMKKRSITVVWIAGTHTHIARLHAHIAKGRIARYIPTFPPPCLPQSNFFETKNLTNNSALYQKKNAIRKRRKKYPLSFFV